MKRPSIPILAIFLVLSVSVSFADRGIAVRPVAPTGETVKGNQWLFVIGVDNYLQWPRLKTAVNDAKAVRDVLLSRYHFDKEHLYEFYDADATRSNILNTFRRLAKQVKPEDSLFVFYAGHGNLDSITKEGFWVPVESGTQDPTAWISNHDVKNYMNLDAIQAKHILLVSDSCFAGDFFRGSRGTLPEVTDVVIKKAYERSSRQAITSGGVEPVSDAGFGGNSVFSHFLVAALKENKKPYLIPSDLFPSVKAGVAQNAEQFPQLGALHGVGGQEGGEYVFFLKQEDRLKDISAASKARQQELEQLKRMEADAARAKDKEQAEIAKKEKELAALDAQIAAMKAKLGTSAAGPNDSLQAMVAMVKQQETEAKQLEDLKKQRQAEESKRQSEIRKLKAEAGSQRRAEIERDIAAYNEIANSAYGKDMIPAAWKSLTSKYPEAQKVAQGDVVGFRKACALSAPDYTDPVTGMKFVLVNGGCFQMGETFGDGHSDEKPVHEVCVDDFYMGKYEVTQGQWKAIRGNNPSNFSNCGDNCPVEQVSWDDAQEFIRIMKQRTGETYRLPTEAEWEYAARSGGKNEKWAGTSIESELSEYAWYTSNSGGKTHPVGQKKPNGMGLYDMSGNVWEWTADWFDEEYYQNSPKDNPKGASSGDSRTLRGGSWDIYPRRLLAANRNRLGPTYLNYYTGFRVLFPAQQLLSEF